MAYHTKEFEEREQNNFVQIMILHNFTMKTKCNNINEFEYISFVRYLKSFDAQKINLEIINFTP